MTTPQDIPDTCPKCGGEVRLRPPLDGTALGISKRNWRCAKGCMSWSQR